MSTATTTSTKARTIPGITLDHGHGIARVYRIIGSTGTTYTTTEATCDCTAGLNGRDCKHCRQIRDLHATETATPTVTPARDPFDLLPAPAPDFDEPADHAVSVETAAQTLGGIQIKTVRRYLAQGKLAPLDGGVSANSVDTYAKLRDANITRTRFKKAAPAVELTEFQEAAAGWEEAQRLDRLVRALKDKYGPVLDRYGVGVHDGIRYEETAGRLCDDVAQIKADYEAWGKPVPKRRAKGSRRFTPVA